MTRNICENYYKTLKLFSEIPCKYSNKANRKTKVLAVAYKFESLTEKLFIIAFHVLRLNSHNNIYLLSTDQYSYVRY